jgi:hypothetical protein
MLAAMSDRLQRVRLETGRHSIEGSIQLPAEGFRSRVKDFFNAHATEFVALTDAVIAPLDDSALPVVQPFIAVSTRHVVLVIELED